MIYQNHLLGQVTHDATMGTHLSFLDCITCFFTDNDSVPQQAHVFFNLHKRTSLYGFCVFDIR